jgi:hypothetical protein
MRFEDGFDVLSCENLGNLVFDTLNEWKIVMGVEGVEFKAGLGVRVTGFVEKLYLFHCWSSCYF